MAFYKMVSNKSKFYPIAVTEGKPVETRELARLVSERCTATKADVYAVLLSVSEAVGECLKSGRSVHLEGLGSLMLKLCSKAVDSPEAFKFERDVTAVRVQLLPERRRGPGKKRYTRELLDVGKLEWLERK